MPKRKSTVESDEYDENDSFLCGSSDEEEMKPPKSAKKQHIKLGSEVDSDYCSKSASSRSARNIGAGPEFVKAELEKVNESLREVNASEDEEEGSESEQEESLSEGATSNEDDSSSEEELEQSENKPLDSESAKSDSDESGDEWNLKKELKNSFKSKSKAAAAKKKKNTIATSKPKRNKASPQQKNSNDKLSGIESDGLSDVEVASDSEEKEQPLEIVEEEILEMYNNATHTEFINLSNVSKSKWETLIAQRPYENYDDLNEKLRKTRLLYLLDQVIQMLNARKIVNNLMVKCKQISKEVKRKIEKVVDTDADTVSEDNHKLLPQPKVLSKKLQLKPYQIIGINWLILMHEQKLNSILADEMGLGKTCQTIAFLAHLYEQNPNGLNLIIVPASTLDNWAREIRMWFPKYLFIMYKGSQPDRREIRDDIHKQIKKKNLNAILTTYNYVASTDADKAFFRKLKLEYCVFDEAHILRNMKSLKYKALMQIKSKRRLLLTGTPLQNNIVELMSLLYFVTPSIFQKNSIIVNKMFLPKSHIKDSDLDKFYQNKIQQVKDIMNPFVLRRLKTQVLKELPTKSENIITCSMPERQRTEYDKLLNYYKKRNQEFLQKKALQENAGKKGLQIKGDSIIKILMEMRKLANHPLLMRLLYTDDKLEKMAHLIVKDSPPDVLYDYVLEDMKFMNDFELHKLCSEYSCIKSYELDENEILASGKFEQLDILLAEAKAKGDRVLIFSQFVIMLNIIQDYLRIRKYKFLRLDGSTRVDTRQNLIDEFNNDHEITVFILTTKAGGVGINLVGANQVIIHDIDYNPHNDKQAEDRAHRLGQVKDVDVYKLICKDSVDESIIGKHYIKLSLDADISENDDSKAKLEVMKHFKRILFD